MGRFEGKKKASSLITVKARLNEETHSRAKIRELSSLKKLFKKRRLFP